MKETVWHYTKMKRVIKPKKMKDFLNEIEQTCKKYNLSISHEDSQGGFIIESYDEYNIKWLKDAFMDF